VDACPVPIKPRQVSLRHHKVGELLGVELPPEAIENYLSRLELKTVGRKPRPVGAPAEPPEPVTFAIPTFRVDLKREVDLIEEVARLYGVDRIPATPPRGAIGANAYDAVHDDLAEARRILTGLGLFEAQGQTLISQSAAALVAAGSVVSLGKPLSSDMDTLRPSLLPGLLDALQHNISYKTYDVALFELGRVFQTQTASASDAAPAVREMRRVAIALTGRRQPLFWSGADREAKFDIYDLKGLVEEFCEQFGLRGLTYARRSEPTALFLESAVIQLGKLQIGELGQLQPTLARKYDLRDAVLLAELDLDQVLARRITTRSFKPLPAYPAIRRDVAMVVPETTTHEAILQVVKQARPAHLESVELFDVFRGRNVPPGQKSMAYAFTYRSAERSLTDAEANASHQRLVEQFKQRLGAVIRE
jgi:phenylalanyl-tRNA synthetase beta chain